MSDRGKRIFLGICIIVPFFIYCFYYYSAMVKNAPFRFTDFEAVELTFGNPDSLNNHYSSITHIYQFERKDGSLNQDTVKLRDNDLLYLHRKAQELGFWNVDDDMTTPDADRAPNAARFKLKFTYKEKAKEVTLDNDYPGNPKMKEAAKTTIDEVLKMIAEAQAR